MLNIIGKEVKFYHNNNWHHGKIVKCNPTRAKVSVENRTWNVPYESLHEEEEQVNTFQVIENHFKQRESRNFDFNVGDSVSFGRPNGKKHYGTIMKVNSKTFLVKTTDNTEYRVPGSLLTTA